MYKSIYISLFLLLISIMAFARHNYEVTLNPGLNEIVIKIDNKTGFNLESLQIAVPTRTLPDGFSVTHSPMRINVKNEKRSEGELLLIIEVANNTKSGKYDIPVLLKDNASHTWELNLAGELEKSLPTIHQLMANYPNPFNPETHIEYDLAGNSEFATQILIYDLLGHQVRILVNEKQPAGHYRVTWDGTNDLGKKVSSGIYFYKLNSGSFVDIRKMTLLK